MTATSHARRDDSDGVITVTFTRDDKRNAVSLEMFDVLQAAVLDLADDDRHRVLVVTAEGRYFTGGLDMADLVGPLGEGTEGVVRGSNIRREYRLKAHHDLFDEMEQVEKPIVLAAQGPCFGVGVEFGVSCDFRLASDATTFALPEVANLGVLPGSGGISRLDADRRPALGAVAHDGGPGRRCGPGRHHRARARGLSGVRVCRTGAGLRPTPRRPAS